MATIVEVGTVADESLIRALNAINQKTPNPLNLNVDSNNNPLSLSTANGQTLSIPSNSPVWRGIGQAMSPASLGYGVGAGISQTVRSRHYSNVRFRQVKACIQTYSTLEPASTVMDISYPFGLNFQVGFETPFTNAVTGLSGRPLFTFSGSPTANYAYITGASVALGSPNVTCTNVLGIISAGQAIFYNTTLIGFASAAVAVGATSFTLASNYAGASLVSVSLTSNNGSTQVAGYMLSDPLDLGAYYTPGTIASPNFFGLHTTVEIANQNIIAGGAITTGTNAFTCTSVSGIGFGVGSPIFSTSSVQIGTVATVVSAGTSYTLAANYTGSTLTSQTMYAAGLPYQRSGSNFLQRNVGYFGTGTQATGIATASSSNTVSITSGANWANGFSFVGPAGSTVPSGTFVLSTTGASGSVTLVLNNAVTVAGVAVTGNQSCITQDIARSNLTYTAYGNSPSGALSNYFTPAQLLIYTNSTLPFVAGFGDSITYGSDEGGYSNNLTGTIASNILTVNSGFNGSAITVGMTFWNAARQLACTVLSNISGAGNGSTWNVTTGVGGTSVTLYGTCSGQYGDSLGSALGNQGWLERGVNEILGYPMMNISRGSDANFMLANYANWQYRAQILQVANPTHVVSANIHNDISSYYGFGASGWTANTAYAKGAVVTGSGALFDYLCVQAGTSGSVNLTGSTYGLNIVDGTAVWQYIFPHISTANSMGASVILGNKYLVNSKIRSLLPGANIIGMLPTPDTAGGGSTDQYSTTANQTVTANGWGLNGGTYSTRSSFAIMLGIPAIQTLVNWSSFFDISAQIEYLGSEGSGKWNVNGTPYAWTYDGTHPNSYGYSIAATNVTSAQFVQV